MRSSATDHFDSLTAIPFTTHDEIARVSCVSLEVLAVGDRSHQHHDEIQARTLYYGIGDCEPSAFVSCMDNFTSLPNKWLVYIKSSSLSLYSSRNATLTSWQDSWLGSCCPARVAWPNDSPQTTRHVVIDQLWMESSQSDLWKTSVSKH